MASSAQALLDPSRLIVAIEQTEIGGASSEATAQARAKVQPIEAERARVLAEIVPHPISRFHTPASPKAQRSLLSGQVL